MPNPYISTVERGRLVEALDTLADVAHAIERAVDDDRRLDEPDDLIGRLRGVIADLAFDLEASDLLGGGEDLHRPAGVRPAQQVLDLGESLRQLDVEHHQARERLFDQLARRGAAASTRCGTCGAPLALDRDGRWCHPEPACAFAADPYLADRHADIRITLRLDPDDHPLVLADGSVVVVYLGDPGAGVAGVRAELIFPGVTARRWFSDLVAQLGCALVAAEAQRRPCGGPESWDYGATGVSISGL
jgi:hypothetical protein